MTNREKLQKMTPIELLTYFDVCTVSLGFNVRRCYNYNDDCRKCREAWLDEPALHQSEIVRGDEDENN